MICKRFSDGISRCQFLFVFKFPCVEISRKRRSCCLDGDAERSSKCSLYGCQQVVNRKLSIHRLKLRLKVNLKIVENWTVKKIQVDMQVRNCRCCLTSKNCWPHCLLMAWFPVHGTIIAAAVAQLHNEQRSHDTPIAYTQNVMLGMFTLRKLWFILVWLLDEVLHASKDQFTLSRFSPSG